MDLRAGWLSVCLIACVAACSGNSDDDGSLPPDGGTDVPTDSTGDTGVDVDAAGPVCGDGVIDDGENCDSAELDGETCVSQGFTSGDLACASDCTLDTSACVSDDPVCGDGTVDDGEDCDSSVGATTCSDLGLGDGVPTCTAACAYDTSGCSSQPVCGNNEVEGTEECDDGNTTDEDGCSSDCFDEECGDGIVQSGLGEECDSGSIVATCEDFGGAVGVQLCAGDCTFDTLLCPDPANCGNGEVDLGEACDDGNTDTDDNCSNDCLSTLCTNGTLDPGEACEGDDFGALSCADFGFTSGELFCQSDCVVDISGCGNAQCGDGNVDPGEQCDDGGRVDGDGCSRRCRFEGSMGGGSLRGTLTTDDADATLGTGTSGDNFGTSIAIIPDVNGDGVDDVIVGALGRDSVSSDEGAAYVLLDFSGGPLSLDGTVEIIGTTGTMDWLGMAVAGGDVNGDGVGDVIIAAPFADPGGVMNAGEVYVFYGPLSPGTLDVANADSTLSGTSAGGLFGQALQVGDLNGDDVDDLVIGAPAISEAFGFFGPLAGSESQGDADVQFVGSTQGDARFGIDVAFFEDSTADALLIGATGDDSFGFNRGAVYVFELPVTPGQYFFNSAPARFGGDANGDGIGWLGAPGDWNDDGRTDIWLGGFGVDRPFAPTRTTMDGEFPEVDQGAAFLQLGGFDGGLGAGATNTFVLGRSASGNLGLDVEGGDINGDGFLDLVLMGMVPNPDGGDIAGAAYVFYGPVNGVIDAGAADAIIYGAAGNFQMRQGEVGDVNNDGFDDLILGATFGVVDGTDSGGIYVFYGAALMTCADDAFCEDLCEDGADDDGDGDIDCADSDCWGIGPCVEVVCTDMTDNDTDDTTDCFDVDCYGADACGESDCSDAIDNDGDGRIDCADSDCECVETICDDFSDNDADGAVDCMDTDCATDGACIACPNIDLGSMIGMNVAMGTTRDEGDDGTAGTCDTGQGGEDVTHIWTAPADGYYEFSTLGSPSFTVIAIYDGECNTTGSELACGGGGMDLNGIASATLSAGQVVTVHIDSIGAGAGGDYVLHIREAEDCTNGSDDDGDGATDCADTECSMLPACGTCPNMDLGSAIGPAVASGQFFRTEDNSVEGSCTRDPELGDYAYTWTAPADGRYRFTVTDPSEAGISIQAGPCVGGVELACETPDPAGASSAELDLVMGEQITIFIEPTMISWNGSYTWFLDIGLVEDCGNGMDDTGNGLSDCDDPQCAGTLACVDCSAAITVPSLPYFAMGDLSGETDDFDVTGSSCDLSGVAGPDVLYEFTAPSSGVYGIRTSTSPTQTIVSVLQNSCEGLETRCGRPDLSFAWMQEAGETVWIVVESIDGGGPGAFEFEIFGF